MHDWLDRLAAADPALERLRTGGRALLTAALASALLLLLAHWLQVEAKLALLGVIVPLMSTVVVQDVSPAGQKKTLLRLPLVAVASIVLASAVRERPWASAACFVAIVFAAFEVRRFGTRGASLGNMAYQGFFYALLLQTDAGDAGWIALFVVLGTAIGYVVRFRIWPERPQQALRHQLRAWRAALASLLCELARAAGGSGRARRHIGAAGARLQDIGLGIETRLAQFAPRAEDAAAAHQRELRDRRLAGELAAETLVAVTQASAEHAGSAAMPLRNALLALRDAVRAQRSCEGTSADAAAAALPRQLRDRFTQAVHALCAVAASRAPLPVLQQEHAAGVAPPARPASPRSEAHRIPIDESTRTALQASVAALLAALAGHLVSADHWFWAVFAAFIVFTRTSSVGQTLSTAWQGVVANVAGVALGLALADATQGSRNVQLVLLFACIGPAFYAYRGWQPLYNMLLTAMLAMLYGILGQQVPRLLATRLAETLVGALVAVACARLVFPARTPEHRDQQSAALLRAAAGLLRDALQAPPRPPPRDAIRALDRQLQALRQTLGPVSAASYPAPKAPHRRRLGQLSLLAACVRRVYAEAARQPQWLAGSPRLQDAAARLGANMEGLADALEGKPHAPLAPVPPLEGGAGGRGFAGDALAQADQVLRALAAEAA